MAIFGPKAWVNPFGKISIVRLFYFLFLQVFLFQNIVKHIFLAYIAKQKQEKWPFLDQDLGLTPLENSLIFDCLNFFFLKHRNVFFSSRISQNTFSWPILPKKNQLQLTHLEEYQFFEFFLFRLSYNTFCWPILAKKKNGKTAIFGPNPLEKSQFFEFLNLFFYIAQKSVFSFQNIVKHTFLAYIA